jgi:CHAT domain-containing protein
MAAFGLGLCLILTLWMTGSRPPTAIPPRSLESSFWWGRESLDINARALALRQAGNLRAAEDLYRGGYDLAVRRADPLAATRFLMSVGGCQLLAYHFQAALSTFLQARDRAAAIQDLPDLAAIAQNLSSLHLQMQDFPAALRSAEEGLAQATHPGVGYVEPYLLLQLGWLHSLLGDGKEEAFYAAGIESARSHGPWTIEAQGWDRLGETRLAAGRLAEAEHAFLEAFRIRSCFLRPQLGYSYARLGSLFLARGDFAGASRFTNRAIAEERKGALSWPRHQLLNQAARIHLARGQTKEALGDFSAAMEASARWRLEALPARSSLTGLNIGLDHQVFRTFIETAAAYALTTGNQFWTERSFQTVEVNRSASLRESRALADAWKSKLPAGYWEILAQLEAAEGRGRLGVGSDARSASLHLRLTEMEAQAGMGPKTKKEENFLSRGSLIHFQDGLSGSELLLSFSLGEKESYLWAVRRTSIRIYRLAAEHEIANAVQAFRAALPAGGTEAVRQGQQLYQQLFGQLGPRETRTTEWLLSLEGTLFDIPFAALVSGRQGGGIVYLADNHSIQIIPGALWLGEAGSRRRSVPGQFVGVGDPIYNTADQRWRSPGKRTTSPEGNQLNRLIGSGKEVEASAGSWAAASGTFTLLTGSDASRTRFLELLAARPAVIHLATHVLIPPDNREQGQVVFGLSHSPHSDKPSPEVLNTSEIAGLSVPGALVVMTGCSTGDGDARAGAGLLGLTRAWLMAGAGAVVSTSWPQEDTSGEILARFYHYFHDHSAAEALRLSQMEVAHSGTWRAAPIYWASYQLTGGSR